MTTRRVTTEKQFFAEHQIYTANEKKHFGKSLPVLDSTNTYIDRTYICAEYPMRRCIAGRSAVVGH
jgi:hypothetical protein